MKNGSKGKEDIVNRIIKYFSDQEVVTVLSM